jgi:hypothetical protein
VPAHHVRVSYIGSFHLHYVVLKDASMKHAGICFIWKYLLVDDVIDMVFFFLEINRNILWRKFTARKVKTIFYWMNDLGGGHLVKLQATLKKISYYAAMPVACIYQMSTLRSFLLNSCSLSVQWFPCCLSNNLIAFSISSITSLHDFCVLWLQEAI